MTDNTEEVRTVSSTGGRKGVKIQRTDLLPVEPLMVVAEHFGRGAEKYTERDEDGTVIHDGANNWRLGYEWNKSYGSLMRHAMQFWGGEDIDPDLGTPHLAGVVFHALVLMDFMKSHPEFDNRPSTLAARAAEEKPRGMASPKFTVGSVIDDMYALPEEDLLELRSHRLKDAEGDIWEFFHDDGVWKFTDDTDEPYGEFPRPIGIPHTVIA